MAGLRQVVFNFVVQVKHFLQERLVLGNRHSFLLRCLGVCHQLLGRCLPHERGQECDIYVYIYI